MTVRTISPAAVQAIIAKGGQVDLIDVRTGMEYQAVHAIGAQHVPLSGLDPAAVLAKRRGGADAPIYIICKSGGRSASACSAFIKAGFNQVFSVDGGTDAWAAAGLPVERNSKVAVLGLIRQAAIFGVVLVVVMLLMPCSPWSVWGSAYCPTNQTPSPSAGTPTPQPASASLDFARDVIAASKNAPVLVDFNATWCGPCKMLGPELEQVASERVGKLTLVKIDVDQHGEVARSQGVESIPDVRLWKDGREVARFVGYKPRAEVGAWLDAALAGKAP